MSFGNLTFIFLFLPASALLYFLIPAKLMPLRNLVLVLLSLVFYAWGEPQYLILLACSLVFNYITGLEIGSFRKEGRRKTARCMLIIGLAVNVLLLFYFKYSGFLLENLSRLTGLKIRTTVLPSPIGLSFYTFTVLSYLIDVYTRKAPPAVNPIDFCVYACFFPKLVSGPIVRYQDMQPQIQSRRINARKAGLGVNLFLIGLGKKVLIADNLALSFAAISQMPTMSSLTAWLGMIFYSLELYFDFSGYSDMAIGLAQMFGFEFSPNFDYPYLSKSVSEFWRRWHISLGAWFREYIYIPLGGNRCSVLRNILNLSVVWLLTGLWHGSAWNFVLWGVYHGVFVILEKYLLKPVMEHIPGILRTLITVLIVFFGWVLFFSPSVGSAFHYFGQMFGAGGVGFADSTSLYYLQTNLVLLITAILGCTKLPRKLHQFITYRKDPVRVFLSVACYILLFILCIAYLVNNTYTSFLYFQF